MEITRSGFLYGKKELLSHPSNISVVQQSDSSSLGLFHRKILLMGYANQCENFLTLSGLDFGKQLTSNSFPLLPHLVRENPDRQKAFEYLS